MPTPPLQRPIICERFAACLAPLLARRRLDYNCCKQTQHGPPQLLRKSWRCPPDRRLSRNVWMRLHWIGSSFFRPKDDTILRALHVLLIYREQMALERMLAQRRDTKMRQARRSIKGKPSFPLPYGAVLGRIGIPVGSPPVWPSLGLEPSIARLSPCRRLCSR